LSSADWQKQTCTLGWLRDREDTRHISILAWLTSLGLIPEGAGKLSHNKIIRLAMDPKKIEIGYLASAACEWDCIGPSRPRDFLNAIELETAGSTRKDTIVETLTALGRTDEGDEPWVNEYRLVI
jgi:hypothetical protein